MTANRYGTVMESFCETHYPPTLKQGNGDPDFARLGRPRGRLAIVLMCFLTPVLSLPRLVPIKCFAGTSLFFKGNLEK